MLPDTLYHYYEAERGPFRSMSELSREEFVALMDELSTQQTPENRFDEGWKRDFYREFRPYVERVIRERFIEKGGRPTLVAPRYLTLGPTAWFLDWYKQPKMVAVPLDAVPDSVLSFTYPDSMMSYLLAEDRFEPFAKFKQPYHGDVYTRTEIEYVVRDYGLPDEHDPVNIEHGNRIIEAQVWDLEPLQPFLV